MPSIVQYNDYSCFEKPGSWSCLCRILRIVTERKKNFHHWPPALLKNNSCYQARPTLSRWDSAGVMQAMWSGAATLICFRSARWSFWPSVGGKGDLSAVIEIASRLCWKLSNSFSRSAKPVVIHTRTKVNKVIISTRMRVVPPQYREKSCQKRTNRSQGQSMQKNVHCIQMFMSLFQIQGTATPLDLFIL